MNCQFLVDAGLYESRDEAIKREEVLGRLDQVTFYKLQMVYLFDLRLSSTNFDVGLIHRL